MPARDGDGRERLIVIGNGMAGGRVVEEILGRGGGERFAITVFGAERHGSYNRVLLSSVLAGSQDSREILLNPLEWYEENGVALHAGVPVCGIDRPARTVTTAEGAPYPYDKLIIATGSRPFLPPVQGLHGHDGALKPGVFAFRTIDDCEAMLGWGRDARRAVVVGGGLLGLEAARGLRERGLEVEIVHRASRLMNLQLDPEAAAMLCKHVERLGIGVRLEASTTRVLGDAAPEGLELADGTRLACDMVVFATGIRPNVELTARAGFVVERGIVVDDAMRAVDCEGVYAVGECAQHRGEVYGLAAPIWQQTAVLADRISGADPRAEYRGSKLVTKLKVSGVELATMGVVGPEREDDEVVRFSELGRGVYKTAIVRDGRLVGATLLGDLARAPFLTHALDHGTVLPQERAALLFDFGGPSAQLGAAELPDDAQICNCNGVSKGDIRACVLAGKRSLREVAATTRASTGCGSCESQVLQVIERALQPAARSRAA
jgi:nitrite reductase (NADH) large subunit